jgi:hypothetical protein
MSITKHRFYAHSTRAVRVLKGLKRKGCES